MAPGQPGDPRPWRRRSSSRPPAAMRPARPVHPGRQHDGQLVVAAARSLGVPGGAPDRATRRPGAPPPHSGSGPRGSRPAVHPARNHDGEVPGDRERGQLRGRQCPRPLTHPASGAAATIWLNSQRPGAEPVADRCLVGAAGQAGLDQAAARPRAHLEAAAAARPARPRGRVNAEPWPPRRSRRRAVTRTDSLRSSSAVPRGTPRRRGERRRAQDGQQAGPVVPGLPGLSRPPAVSRAAPPGSRSRSSREVRAALDPGCRSPTRQDRRTRSRPGGAWPVRVRVRHPAASRPGCLASHRPRAPSTPATATAKAAVPHRPRRARTGSTGAGAR